MWQRFTEWARKAVFYALEEAQAAGQAEISTEHLLLGVLRNPEYVAYRVLAKVGIDVAQLSAALRTDLPRGPGTKPGDTTMSAEVRSILDGAYQEARELDNNYIGTEHLLLGFIHHAHGPAAEVLTKAGASLELVRRTVADMQDRAENSSPQRTVRAFAPEAPVHDISFAFRARGADFLALSLLAGDDLDGPLSSLGLCVGPVAQAIALKFLSSAPGDLANRPTVAETVDAAAGRRGIFGAIARDPRTLTHEALIELGATDSAIRDAFAE